MYVNFLCVLAICFSSFFSNSFLFGKEALPSQEELKLSKYFLPSDHPIQATLDKLFTDPNIFDHPAYLIAAGFKFFNHYAENLMVCTHPLLNDYVIKKFTNSVKQSTQLKRYLRRIKAAQATARFIKTNQIENLIIPKKYLYRLPENFSRQNKNNPTYLLVAEKIDLCNKKETQNRYYQIEEQVLAELCLFVSKFRGLDSSIGNLPFTKSNKIAFIDLDKWEDRRSDEFLSQVKHVLNIANKQYVEAFEAKYLIKP